MSTKPTFAAVPDLVSMPLRHSYLRTVITVDIDGRTMPADRAVKALKKPLLVISASNPWPQLLEPEENRRRQLELAAALDAAGLDRLDAHGSDPDSSWGEESFALIGRPHRRAKKLCRDCDQHAYFEITLTSVIVHGCNGSWKISRRHGESSLPEGADTLGAAVAESIGFTITDRLKRFRYPGWRHLGPTELLCGSCGGKWELFALVREQKSGLIVEHLAVVCPDCRQAEPVTSLPAAERLMIHRWRDHLLAIADSSSERPDKADHTFSCYVVELKTEADEPASVYVGQSAKDPEARLAEHLKGGDKYASIVRTQGLDLRRDLMVGLPVFADRLSAETYEVYLGAKLKLAGLTVYGAH